MTVTQGQLFFVSHGGPPTMYDYEAPAYAGYQRVGEILRGDKPRGVVIVSAHWENDRNEPGVIVNEDTSNPLIYDFYNFPKHYYSETFESTGSPDLFKAVASSLSSSGISYRTEKRGLDHGAWLPLKVAFGGKTDIPILQVSLPGDSSGVSAAKLGEALGKVRDEGYTVIASGQVVHNLRDLRITPRAPGEPSTLPYLNHFMNAARAAITKPNPTESVIGLMKNKYYKGAHPTDEHFLPLPLAAGAVRPTDKVDELVFDDHQNLGWGMWHWKSIA